MWRYHPKHVEQFTEINKLYIVTYSWTIIDIRDNLRSQRKELQIFRVPGLRYKMQSDKQTWYNPAARKINSTHKHFQLSAVKKIYKGNRSPMLQRKHVNSHSQHARLLQPTLGAFCLHLSAEISPQNLHLSGVSISRRTPFFLQYLRFSQWGRWRFKSSRRNAGSLRAYYPSVRRIAVPPSSGWGSLASHPVHTRTFSYSTPSTPPHFVTLHFHNRRADFRGKRRNNS